MVTTGIESSRRIGPSISESIQSQIVELLPSSSSSSHYQGSSYSVETIASSTDNVSSQLSHDLALFLSNPSIRAALADGSLDLSSYSSQVDSELQELESSCIAKYREKAGDVAEIRSQLLSCQAVLETLHLMLLGFQEDLSGLSGEIRNLQEKSRNLDVQLRNRRQAEEGLRLFLQRIVIAPNLAQTIITGSVNPLFLQCVQELRQIYKDCFQTAPQTWAASHPPCETCAGKEVQKQVTQLRLVAVSKTREYFLQQMTLLRRPQTNIRMIQVHGLLKYTDLQDFLDESCLEVSNEILNVYIESMSKTFLVVFRTYQSHLLQLDATKFAATRQDVIAIDDSTLKETLMSPRANKKRNDVFYLGDRAVDCLDGKGDQLNAPILVHVALAENVRYPYERLFRSLIGHLIDAVTNEHIFCRLFFKRDAFGPLFHPTLGLMLEQLENYLFGCYDALCLLLMIKVTHSYRTLLRLRHIHSLDNFLNQITKLLWPRLKYVMDGHLKSIKHATAAKLGFGNIVDELQLLHIHYVTRRFAEFCCSILLILHSPEATKPVSGTASSTLSTAQATRSATNRAPSPNAIPSKAKESASATLPSLPSFTSRGSKEDSLKVSAGDKLLEDMTIMIEEYVNLLDRLAEEQSSQKKRIVFKINNLDHMVCMFQERRVMGREFNHFVSHLMKQREMFVEEELLTTGFSKMIAFIQETEIFFSDLPKGVAAHEQINSSVVESLVLDFASSWKSNIEQMNRNVLSYFSNFRNGMEILKQVLTQLLLYYTRFHDVIRKTWRNKPPAFCKDLVSTNQILIEIKKYALSI